MRRQPASGFSRPGTPVAPDDNQPPPAAAASRMSGSAGRSRRGPHRLGLGPAMAALRHLSGVAAGATLPRRTVRLRLTALYGALFLASGAGLLAITNIVARGWPAPKTSWTSTPAPGPGHAGDGAIAHRVQVLVAGLHTATLNQLLADSAIALAVMAVASVGLGWLVAGRVLRPLAGMTAAARAISEDNLHERLAVAGPGDELKDLGDTIDGLLQRLETAFAAQRRFAASASHELRTPLAMMRTSLDVATAKPGPIPPEVTVLAGKLREGLDQADRLLESLLLLARAQYGAKDDQEAVCLGRVLASAIEACGDPIARRGLQVRQATADAWVTGNATLLSRMAGNLIDNAVRHNQPGGWICTETTADDAVARLVVENGGPVLDQDRVTGLGQPFQRLGAERTGSADGTGLGLSIVEAIVSAHGGTLDLRARPDGGLRVLIELPRTTGTSGAAPMSARTGAVR
jgi:signal transduction histidine kinase